MGATGRRRRSWARLRGSTAPARPRSERPAPLSPGPALPLPVDSDPSCPPSTGRTGETGPCQPCPTARGPRGRMLRSIPRRTAAPRSRPAAATCPAAGAGDALPPGPSCLKIRAIPSRAHPEPTCLVAGRTSFRCDWGRICPPSRPPAIGASQGDWGQGVSRSAATKAGGFPSRPWQLPAPSLPPSRGFPPTLAQSRSPGKGAATPGPNPETGARGSP